MHFVFFGPEGSGKGTQAKLLSQKLGLPVFTTGDLVREAAANDKTKLGNMCRKVLLEGKYLPDKEVSKLLETKLKSDTAKKGFILDGFPRSLKQAQFLDETIRKSGYDLDKFIYLKLADGEAVKRLAKRKRAIFGGSKILHDDPERVRQRLAVYRKNEKNVLEFYKDRNLFLEVDALGRVEEIFNNILRGLNIG